MATTNSNKQRDGVYLPKGVAYLLGTQMYAQVLQENNVFLMTVATIPMNLTYDAWFAVINQNQTSENEPILLHDYLLQQSWFLQIESVGPNKCLLVTKQTNLQEAQDWIDANLEQLICKLIPDRINLSSSLLPRRLDKPIYSATSLTYADILKKQASLAMTPTAPATTNNRPPRKRQATLIDYDSDDSTASMAVTAAPNLSSQSQAVSPPATPAPLTTYATELLSLKEEMLSIRNIITEAVAQLKSALAAHPTPSTAAPNATTASSAMETEADSATTTTPEISALIAYLKHDIATIAMEMRAKFQQQAILYPTIKHAPP